LKAIVVGGVVSTLFALVIATQLFASDVADIFASAAATRLRLRLRPVLRAVRRRHLVGLWVESRC